MDILSSRSEPRFGKVEAIILATYSLLVAWTIAHHVPWADEAQAWLLARDSSLYDLFTVWLHYEGSPGLFHLLLWGLCQLHVSYGAMHWLMGIIAIAGIWVFLRYSPFPLILRIILPFTFYLMYQYAVIARSYVLVPLLVFSVAAMFSKPGRNLVGLAVVLGLLSNISAHGFVLSAGFAFILVLRLWKERGIPSPFLTSKRLAVSGIILGTLWAIAISSAMPAMDNTYIPPATLFHRPEKTAAIPSSGHPVEGAPTSANVPDVQQKPLDWSLLARAKRKYATVRLEITGGLSTSLLVSLGVLSITLAYLISRKSILDIAPYVLLQVFFDLVFWRPWHFGMALIALIAILWIDWPSKDERRNPRWTALLVVALLSIGVEQTLWSVRAITAEMRGPYPYSGDQQTTAFLQSHLAGKKAAGFEFLSVGVLPYFPSNIYFNQPKHGFWFWGSGNHVADQAMETVQEHPDYIVIGFDIHSGDLGGKDTPAAVNAFRQNLENQILATGLYVETHRFCGDAFLGHDYHDKFCQVILEPSGH